MVETIWGPVPAIRKRRAGAASLHGEEAKAARVKARKRAKSAPDQLSLGEVVAWGGRRAGAGRKPGPRRATPHLARDVHARWNPVHVTLRCVEGLPSLRSPQLEPVLRRALEDTSAAREDFRITHYSMQADHLHLIVEADGHDALSRGMRSLAVRIARRVNGALGRAGGRVWHHRHHRHELLTPSEVRHALVYVLNNYRKHGEARADAGDACSSARWFTEWMHAPEPSPEPAPTRPAITWLLREGWLTVGHGPIHRDEVPRAARR